jgi:hypothetical protein
LLTAYLKGGRLPQSDEDRLLTTAQGNPFYLAELATLLMERGALTKAGAQWRLVPGSMSATLLTRDLAAVLAARIDALPPEARAVLRDAAVVGDSVPTGALEALRDRRSGRDTRPAAVVAVELERAIDELLQRRMLRRLRGGFAFATPLLREAAYAGIGKTDLAERTRSSPAGRADRRIRPWRKPPGRRWRRTPTVRDPDRWRLCRAGRDGRARELGRVHRRARGAGGKARRRRAAASRRAGATGCPAWGSGAGPGRAAGGGRG